MATKRVLVVSPEKIFELNEIYKEITRSEKNVVTCAIKAGQILDRARSHLPKDMTFERWVEKNCKFSRMHAYRFIKVYTYSSDKRVSDAATLTDAVGAANTIARAIDAQVKQESDDRIATYEATGTKPKGWTQTDSQRFRERHGHYPDENPISKVQKVQVPDAPIAPVSASDSVPYTPEEWGKELEKEMERTKEKSLHRYEAIKDAVAFPENSESYHMVDAIATFFGGFEKESDAQGAADEIVTFIRDVQSHIHEVWEKVAKE